ncbi:hypothetical protein ACWD48_31620 [Streptomyces sp. NPDC002519]
MTVTAKQPYQGVVPGHQQDAGEVGALATPVEMDPAGWKPAASP